MRLTSLLCNGTFDAKGKCLYFYFLWRWNLFFSCFTIFNDYYYMSFISWGRRVLYVQIWNHISRIYVVIFQYWSTCVRVPICGEKHGSQDALALGLKISLRYLKNVIKNKYNPVLNKNYMFMYNFVSV